MQERAVRLPTVAGQFYEANPTRLRKDIERFLAEKELVKLKGAVRAVILPHAGYMYSGGVAARTMAVAKGEKFTRLVVIAPSHRCPVAGIAVPSYAKCRTPLGDMEVDLEAVGNIPQTKLFPRTDQPHAQEHALEVELPLAQVIFPDTPVVPLICGQIDSRTASELADGLMPLWGDGNLWIISSDFTHYGASFAYVPFTDDVPQCLKDLDLGAVEKIVKLDRRGFEEYVRRTGATICGAHPIAVMLAAAEKAAAKGERLEGELVEYTTSGELTGDYSHTVSYAGIAVINSIAPHGGDAAKEKDDVFSK